MAEEQITTEVKPGLKSTEFYVHTGVAVLSLLASLGVINPLSLTGIEHLLPPVVAGISQLVISIGGLVTALVSATNYSKKRTDAKINQAKMNVVAVRSAGPK